MNEEQKQLCTRIAIENPRLTVAQIRGKMLEHDPNLVLSDSTVWRTLHASNLQFLRAKMKDPRAEGTASHKAEKQAFLKELQKGAAGELGSADLFFMDETTVYLNETARRAWGTAEHPAEIKKAKGKTVTIGIYAGLGLVSSPLSQAEWEERAQDRESAPKLPTDPRSNAFRMDHEGNWTPAGSPPRFALFWWLRPPTRANTVIEKFLTVEDILDPHFTLAFYILPPGTYATKKTLDNIYGDHSQLSDLEYQSSPTNPITLDDDERLINWNSSITWTTRTSYLPVLYESSIINENGTLNTAFVEMLLDFLNAPNRMPDDEHMHRLLWRNNIEHRQTDSNGTLINVTSRSRTKRFQKVLLARNVMIDMLKGLANLIVKAIGTSTFKEKPRDEVIRKVDLSVPLQRLPRAYYNSSARNYLGGRIEGERGDQSLFLQYIKMTTDYYKDNFPDSTKQNLRMAWDSAPQHGKVDVTRNKKSFIHDWAEETLGIRGAIFLPVREPDYNPSELLFSFVKSVIRRKMHSPFGELTETEMIKMVDSAFCEVTEDMVKGWLRYGCYRIEGEDPATIERTHRCLVDDDTMMTYDVIGDLLTVWEARHQKLTSDQRT
eukprot:1437983-Prymnesium_polylepis.1